MPQWGGFEGAGYRGKLQIEDDLYKLLAFCSTERLRSFEVLMVVDEAQSDKLAPGFQLIRDSLELRPALGL